MANDDLSVFICGLVAEDIVGKPLTLGQPGPRIGTIIRAEKTEEGHVVITASVDDPKVFKGLLFPSVRA